jgi:hypothetical protein
VNAAHAAKAAVEVQGLLGE